MQARFWNVRRLPDEKMPDKILKQPSFSVLGAPSLLLVRRMPVDVFTRAGGQNVRCFGGKTLRGLRNSITRIVRRESRQHVLFKAFQSNIALVSLGESAF